MKQEFISEISSTIVVHINAENVQQSNPVVKLLNQAGGKVVLIWTQKDLDDDDQSESIKNASKLLITSDEDSDIYEADHSNRFNLRNEIVRSIQRDLDNSQNCLSHEEIVSLVETWDQIPIFLYKLMKTMLQILQMEIGQRQKS